MKQLKSTLLIVIFIGLALCGCGNTDEEKTATPIVPMTEEISSNDILFISTAPIIDSNATRFEFPGTAPSSVAAASVDIEVNDVDEILLNIETCTWVPEHNTLHIGFYNVDTSIGYYQEITGGNYSDSILYQHLPTGIYRLYIKNTGATELTTGYLKYRLR